MSNHIRFSSNTTLASWTNDGVGHTTSLNALNASLSSLMVALICGALAIFPNLLNFDHDHKPLAIVMAVTVAMGILSITYLLRSASCHATDVQQVAVSSSGVRVEYRIRLGVLGNRAWSAEVPTSHIRTTYVLCESDGIRFKRCLSVIELPSTFANLGSKLYLDFASKSEAEKWTSDATVILSRKSNLTHIGNSEAAVTT